ncbi:MAG: hypothetical protein JNJ70_06415, partial [Verrucomicrobiales bacterium]|nr:hypothetical protein [Verrucomicrobiales bacterium]
TLTEDWQEHQIEFEIRNEFKDETILRFSMPDDASGIFDLSDPRLKEIK